jgi:tight adherence protein C
VTKRRVAELQKRREDLRGEYASTKRKKVAAKKKEEEKLEMMQRVVKRFNLIQDNTRRELEEFLYSAGYREKSAIVKYAFTQGALVIGLMLFSLLYVKFDLSNFSLKSLMNLMIPFGAVYVGFWLPKVLVVNNRTKRWKECQKGLPDALDLMMICTEAGLTLGAALKRVSGELELAYPTLAEELSITSVELGFLPDKRTALENLAKRVSLPEVRSLVSILIQTEKYGTPVSQALRILAKEFRTQRMLRAEQKAARLPAIMTVPMILLILPTMFIIVIAPAMIRAF